MATISSARGRRTRRRKLHTAAGTVELMLWNVGCRRCGRVFAPLLEMLGPSGRRRTNRLTVDLAELSTPGQLRPCPGTFVPRQGRRETRKPGRCGAPRDPEVDAQEPGPTRPRSSPWPPPRRPPPPGRPTAPLPTHTRRWLSAALPGRPGSPTHCNAPTTRCGIPGPPIPPCASWETSCTRSTARAAQGDMLASELRVDALSSCVVGPRWHRSQHDIVIVGLRALIAGGKDDVKSGD